MGAEPNILEKARKLMALAESTTNEHEAINATAKLQVLLDKHNLSMAGLSQKEISNKIECIFHDYPNKTRKDHAFINLANSLAHGYGCDVIIGRRNIEFIGVGVSAVVTSNMFTYLWKTLNQIAEDKAKISGVKGAQIKSFKNSFVIGAANRILSRLYDKNEEPDDSAAGKYELKRVDALEQAVKTKYPNLGSYDYKPKVTDSLAFTEGVKTGKNISLNDQLESDYKEPEKIETNKAEEPEIEEESEMEFKDIINFLEDGSSPHDIIRNLVEHTGISAYKIAKESGVNRATLDRILKENVNISNEVAIRLAMFFELNDLEFAMKCSLDRVMKTKESCNVITGGYRDWIKHFKSENTCQHCSHGFSAFYTGRKPEYGDTFWTICPKCSQKITALQRDVTFVKVLPDGVTKAIRNFL
ncbi:MAG: DUF2786 domain-containing protein [Lentisphaeraceae bacterium]|nr:DUF2786 domain-containing protein [Lentisphaeraceae bacterium]